MISPKITEPTPKAMAEICPLVRYKIDSAIPPPNKAGRKPIKGIRILR